MRIWLGVWITLIVLILTTKAQCQDYTHSLGLRGGVTNGISYKTMISEQDAAELIAGFQYDGLQVTGLYERHTPALNVDHLFWYYGAGGHLGFYGNDYDPPYNNDQYGGSPTIGLDGIGGLEYRIPNVPLNICVDVKPFLEFTGPDIFLWDTGISIRYRF